jgi:hypothetical protein
MPSPLIQSWLQTNALIHITLQILINNFKLAVFNTDKLTSAA